MQRSLLILFTAVLLGGGGCGGKGDPLRNLPRKPDSKERLLINRMSDKILARYEEHGLNGLTPPETYFMFVWNIDNEVYNGGFFQYFFNESGAFAGSTIKALEAVGAPKKAKILGQANALFREGPPGDMSERRRELTFFNEKKLQRLEELDKLFTKRSENLEPLMVKFLNKYRGQIISGTE